jgi:hypothetical protein
MKIECSLLHSQQFATYAYSEPDQRSPCSHPTSWRSILILSFHLRLGLPVFSFSIVSSPSLHFFCLSYVPHAPPIQLFLIWSPENIWCHVFFSTLPLPRHFRLQRLPQHPILERLQPMFLPQCERLGSESIKDSRPNYTSVNFKVWIFHRKLEEKYSTSNDVKHFPPSVWS